MAVKQHGVAEEGKIRNVKKECQKDILFLHFLFFCLNYVDNLSLINYNKGVKKYNYEISEISKKYKVISKVKIWKMKKNYLLKNYIMNL